MQPVEKRKMLSPTYGHPKLFKHEKLSYYMEVALIVIFIS